jgi:hypothetical protein
MSAKLNNLKYGQSVDINSDYAVVGNPSSFLLDPVNVGTGSVVVSARNFETNQFSQIAELKKNYSIYATEVLLAIDTGSFNVLLDADTNNTYGLDIAIDDGSDIVIPGSDGYGTAVAVSSSVLAIGCPYVYYTLSSGPTVFKHTGSVEIFDLTDINSTATASYIIYNSSSVDLGDTFGESVAIEGNTLVVGSSESNSTYGASYIYTQSAITNDWLLYQTLVGSEAGNLYGGVVRIDPSGSKKILIGHKSTGSFGVDLYEFNSGTTLWEKTVTFTEDKTITGSLNFIDSPTVVVLSDTASNYGHSVDIYDNYVVIGAPNDMFYYEYDGSGTIRNRGAVYFYHNCSEGQNWTLLNKSFGNDKLPKSNKFGSNVNIYNNFATAININDILTHSSSYITNTLNKKYDCNPLDAEIDLLGQCAVYQLNTASVLSPSWDIKTVIDKRKTYGYPYVSFGFDAGIQDDYIIVGAPLFLADPEAILSASSAAKGYAYIYNLNDLKTDVQVGNVFYRDGKIVLSNSGSMFDGLLRDSSNPGYSAYDITYKSQLTVYEKQIVCRIEPGEFNYTTNPTALILNEFEYDIDKNNFFDFIDLDLICRYISLSIYNDELWYDHINLSESDKDWIEYYYEKHNLYDKPTYYLTQYSDYLKSIYPSFDVDGNKKININDINLMWKYFLKSITVDDVFKYIDIKSTRKSMESIMSYLDGKTGRLNYGKIKPEFFEFNYSSSIDKTGSYIAPFITTIGLYNGADLVAVAKLGTPIKNGGEFPLNFLIKWDI